MFIAATYVAVRESVANAGPYAIEGAFRWLDSQAAKEYLPSQPWRDALAPQAAKVLAQGSPLPPAHLALCAWLAAPDAARKLLAAGRPDVQNLAQQPLQAIPGPLREHTAFLLVTLGLRAEGSEGLKPLVRGFFDVHEALASVRFSSESWQTLSPELPRLKVWRDWDRCEKLRRAARTWLSEHVKSGNPLLDAADTQTRQDIARRVFRAPADSDDFLD